MIGEPAFGGTSDVGLGAWDEGSIDFGDAEEVQEGWLSLRKSKL